MNKSIPLLLLTLTTPYAFSTESTDFTLDRTKFTPHLKEWLEDDPDGTEEMLETFENTLNTVKGDFLRLIFSPEINVEEPSDYNHNLALLVLTGILDKKEQIDIPANNSSRLANAGLESPASLLELLQAEYELFVTNPKNQGCTAEILEDALEALEDVQRPNKQIKHDETSTAILHS